MNYLKDDLNNTTLPTITLEGKKYFDYPQIGFGDEGAIYKYNNKIAFKTFEFFKKEELLYKKFQKIELLGQLHDDCACFPMGLVGFKDNKKEGYYCELVDSYKKLNGFDSLTYLKNKRLLLKYIIEADKAIERFHKMGLIICDIK